MADQNISVNYSNIVVNEGILSLSNSFSLYHGKSIDNVQVAWRMSGPINSPVIAVLGGISAHRLVYSLDSPAQGWWRDFAGIGLSFPIDRYQVLSFDYLGGSGETTGPRGHVFPSISSYDQAELLCLLLDHLEIQRLNSVIGPSYGGMVALAFGERHPNRVAHLFIMSAADRADPLSTAWRCVQRRTVEYAIAQGKGEQGLQLARALAMATYRSREEFSERFRGLPRQDAGKFVFPIEEYLLARGKDYAARYKPDSFLCLSESIDLHSIDAANVSVPVTAIAVHQDQLVPIEDMRAMVKRLPQATLHEISSHYGHDAFLKEARALKPYLDSLLGE